MAHIALIGLPGSGKSTLGPLLGEALQAPFLDVDKVLEESSGWTPRQWVEDHDWETFRSAESVVLASLHRNLNSTESLVLGCGGGIVEAEENRVILEKWQCVWLDAHDDVLVDRTRNSDRPGHPGISSADVPRVLRAQREKWYRLLGGEAVDTSTLQPEEVLAVILKRWGNR